MLEWLKGRLKEPSTYVAVAGVIGVVLPSLQIDVGTLQSIGAALLFLIGMIVKDPGSKS